MRDHYLALLSRQDHAFAPLGPIDDRFRVVVARHIPAIPSFVSLAQPASSPYLNANEEIDLLAIGSLGCKPLHRCQMDQVWAGEPLDLLAAEGYRTTVGAKPLHVIDETFCLNPTDGAKCWYLIRLAFRASAGQCEPTRKREKGYGGHVSAVSPMPKLAKKMEKIRKSIGIYGIAYLFLVGGFFFYT